MSSQTLIGRVQPLYKGTYDSTTTYNKLDNVFYDGSTWLCLIDSTRGVTPTTNSNRWQMIASKGDQGIQGNTGGIGNPIASATILQTGADPTVTVSTSGPSSAKVFNFQFGIPAGPYGFDTVSAVATSLAAGTQPTVTPALTTTGDVRDLSFTFGIPAANGQGVQSVDNITANANSNVALSAVRYAEQSLTSSQQAQARANIAAAKDPTSKSADQYLKWNGTDWVAESILQVPSGGITDQVLSKQAVGYGWVTLHSTPSGGAEGAALVKASASDYDLTWSAPITTSEIDAMMVDTNASSQSGSDSQSGSGSESGQVDDSNEPVIVTPGEGDTPTPIDPTPINPPSETS